ncbi:hypothetical protein ABZT17_44935, partial [Streptomyces sp. NPDC005648]
MREAVGRLGPEPAAAPARRPIRVPSWGDWSLELDDFLLTRLMKLVVHADDLARSVGLPAPGFPEEATAPVVELPAAESAPPPRSPVSDRPPAPASVRRPQPPPAGPSLRPPVRASARRSEPPPTGPSLRSAGRRPLDQPR